MILENDRRGLSARFLLSRSQSQSIRNRPEAIKRRVWHFIHDTERCRRCFYSTKKTNTANCRDRYEHSSLPVRLQRMNIDEERHFYLDEELVIISMYFSVTRVRKSRRTASSRWDREEKTMHGGGRVDIRCPLKRKRFFFSPLSLS